MPDKTKSRNSRNTKKTGGEDSTTRLPSLDDVSKIQGLDFHTKHYQDLNYDKYINQVRLSNFTKGGNLKSILKQAYTSYMQGGDSSVKSMQKKSRRKIHGGQDDFPVSDKQLRNIQDLHLGSPFQIPKLQRISKAPYSNFAI